jgi:hypothetical protein
MDDNIVPVSMPMNQLFAGIFGSRLLLTRVPDKTEDPDRTKGS